MGRATEPFNFLRMECCRARLFPFPQAGVPSQALSTGNPFTSISFLADARMLIGDNSGIMAYYYNHRLYYFDSKFF
jgi:hypothetical protein